MSEENKIITPENPAPQPAPQAENEAEPSRLTQQVVNSLAGAVAQLVEIESRAVIQPNDDKLKAELRKFIANIFLKHSQEFIGCWFTVRVEYEPLCQTIAHVLGHVDAIRQQQYKHRRELEKQLSEAAAKLKAEQETPKQV